MAKKKNQGLPKRIAGVKVPKSLRKGRLGDLLASPAGKVLITDILLAAGAAVIAHEGKQGSKTRRLAQDASDVLERSSETAADASARLTHAFAAAVKTFREALDAPSAEAPDAEAAGKKNKIASPTLGDPVLAH